MKGCIHLILGGARSGKSTYAEKMVKSLGGNVLYLATAVITDADMADRIDKHMKSRPATWKTIEKFKNFEDLISYDAFIEADVLLLDCLTVMMTNLMFDSRIDFDETTPSEIERLERFIKEEIDKLLDLAQKSGKHLVIVSNEVGLGLVPAYKLGNYFRDISGRMNQHVAQIADFVTFVAAGLPLKLKGENSHD